MKPTVHKPRGETRFPGIVRHAEQLGCSRVHLNLVLSGKRTSKSLLKGYRDLLKSEGRVVPANLGKSGTGNN